MIDPIEKKTDDGVVVEVTESTNGPKMDFATAIGEIVGSVDIRRSVVRYYDEQAETYFEKYSDEVSQKPYDRAFLERFAHGIRPGGKVLDIGCSSSAQQANYLADRFQVTAIDLSPGNIDVARRHFPKITFQVMDMRTLAFEAATFDGVCAFYSLIHIPGREIESVLREIARVLKPDGSLAFAVHEGDFEGIVEDQRVFFKAYSKTELAHAISEAGWEFVYRDHRKPIYDFEYQSSRLYAIVRRKGTAAVNSTGNIELLSSIRPKIPVLLAVPDTVYYHLDPVEFLFPDPELEQTIAELEKTTGHYIMCYRSGVVNTSPRSQHLCSRAASALLSDEHYALLRERERKLSVKKVIFVAYKKPLQLRESMI